MSQQNQKGRRARESAAEQAAECRESVRTKGSTIPHSAQSGSAAVRSKTENEGKTLTGAEAVIASLEAEGVEVVFG